MAQDKARPTRARTKKEAEAAEPTPKAREPRATVASPGTVAKPRTGRKKATRRTADDVAFHAYLLWERGVPGDATEHWLRAEQELEAA
jgi:hypothetical protein